MSAFNLPMVVPAKKAWNHGRIAAQSRHSLCWLLPQRSFAKLAIHPTHHFEQCRIRNCGHFCRSPKNGV